MDMVTHTAVHLSGMLSIIGACLYTIGDELILATPSSPLALGEGSVYPFFWLVDERAIVPGWRLVWHRVLGIFAAPFMLAGIWQVYEGLHLAGLRLALPPALLLAYVIIIDRPFIVLSKPRQTFNVSGDDLDPDQSKDLRRSYTAPLIEDRAVVGCVMIASLWFSVAVASGRTYFPMWMAAVNPLVTKLVWLLSRKALPKKVATFTVGDRFNLAYLIFFTLTTLTLW